MLRKNDASAIEKQTSSALTGLKATSTTKSAETPSLAVMNTALDTVCKLQGIGPATGTLILNIFDPVNIPFFQDEMYLWFFPDTKGDKLKYSLKEYRGLFEAVGPVLKRLDCKAVELEKVAYVLGHMNMLEQEERKGLEESVSTEHGAGKTDHSPTNKDAGGEDDEKATSSTDHASSKTGRKVTSKTEAIDELKEPTVAKTGKKRTTKDEASKETEPAAKRRSQRNR